MNDQQHLCRPCGSDQHQLCNGFMRSIPNQRCECECRQVPREHARPAGALRDLLGRQVRVGSLTTMRNGRKLLHLDDEEANVVYEVYCVDRVNRGSSWIAVESERLRALMRMLIDSGDATPMAQRQIESILEETAEVWPSPMEQSEWEALAAADFEGLPREALVASIHDLARRLLAITDAPE